MVIILSLSSVTASYDWRCLQASSLTQQQHHRPSLHSHATASKTQVRWLKTNAQSIPQLGKRFPSPRDDTKFFTYSANAGRHLA